MAAPAAARGMKKKPALTPMELVRARVDQALREGEVAMERATGQVLVLDPHPTKASPWLELTRWPEYLRGQDLTTVALLGGPPNPREEPLPAQLAASVQRLINTFHRESRVWNQPIQIHLWPKTYHQYCQVWQRLVCFAYHSSQPNQPVWLQHQLNTAQLAALDQMEEYSRGLLALTAEEAKAKAKAKAKAMEPGPALASTPPRAPRTVPGKKSTISQATPLLPPPASTLPRLAPWPWPPTQAPVAATRYMGPIPKLPKPPSCPREVELQAWLDEATLELSIALLDHPLKGDLFKSTLVGFLAVLGVDAAC
ncbi:hypothetical protein BJX62DRAFT_245826 [Aspergillus germanicus]